MNPFTFLYNEALFRPLFNLLVGIANSVPGHNIGVSILMVTVLVRLLLLPPSLHQARQMQANQEKMSQVRGRLKEIEKEHKDDQAKKAEETMKVYREAGINPASGCLPLLIQLPILIALYRVFLVGLNPETYQFLYSFVSVPEQAQLTFLSINLEQPSLLLGVIAGAAQFLLMRMATSAAPTPTKGDEQAEMMASMQKNMMYVFPVMTVFISFQLPAALALYWVASTVFGIVQQYYFKKYLRVSGVTPV